MCAYVSLTLVVCAQVAAALGITRDILVTRHNPHNGLRFFYVDLNVPPVGSVQNPRLPPGAVRVFVGPEGRQRNVPNQLGQNHLAQGLMRKGDKNHDAPIIRGPCYVCKQCTDRDPFASCFPEDFDVITGRSRVTAAEHLLVLGDLEEQTDAKKAKHDPSLSAPSKKDEEDPPKKEEESHTIEISGVVVNEEDLLAEGATPTDSVAQDAAVVVPDPPAMAVVANEEDVLPAKLAPLRDMVYCQILLGGIKGAAAAVTAASLPKAVEDEEQPQLSAPQAPTVVEHVLSSSPPPPLVVDVATTTMTTTTSSPQPETDDAVVVEKPKKPTRRGRRTDVCADNIVPEGVRRSARLRK